MSYINTTITALSTSTATAHWTSSYGHPYQSRWQRTTYSDGSESWSWWSRDAQEWLDVRPLAQAGQPFEAAIRSLTCRDERGLKASDITIR